LGHAATLRFLSPLIEPDGQFSRVRLSDKTLCKRSNGAVAMDSAYDAPEIEQKSQSLGHVPIIDRNPRRGGKAAAEAHLQHVSFSQGP